MKSGPDDATRREKVLLVDDVAGNLTLLTELIEPRGFEILAASDGTTALRIAARAQPDLILLDVLMPEMDGIETCRRLKSDPGTRDIPVIFITGRGDGASVVEGFRVGGVDYIVKPFENDEVLSRISTHLRLNRLARELME